MNVYISNNYSNLTSAGNKARTDIDTLMSRMGFRNLGPEKPGSLSPLRSNLRGAAKAAARLRKGDIIFLQYPQKKFFTHIARIAHMRDAKVVALVHDLASYRGKTLTKEQEIRRLRYADYIIAGNEAMRKALVDAGIVAPIGVLEAWDYLTETDPIPSRISDGEPHIAFAGSLNRRSNGFLWEWGKAIKGYSVDIYGSGFRMDEIVHPERFYYHGFVPAEKIIVGMTCDFGLVWDGDSIEKSSENDEYLRLNTPHKLSLYLRARLPIIIWSGAAMAPFVVENGIGFTVDSLAEIPAKLKGLTQEQFDDMRANIDRMAARIASGEFFTSAANAAIKALSSK